eukprot:g33735.t1
MVVEIPLFCPSYNGLDQIGKWAEEWQMEFNLDTCEVLHFRKTIANGKILGSVAEQRDLREHVFSSLKVESQVGRIVKKVFGTLAFI